MSDKVTCGKCHKAAKFQQFTSFSYWYCYNCKQEVDVAITHEEDRYANFDPYEIDYSSGSLINANFIPYTYSEKEEDAE